MIIRGEPSKDRQEMLLRHYPREKGEREHLVEAAGVHWPFRGYVFEESGEYCLISPALDIWGDHDDADSAVDMIKEDVYSDLMAKFKEGTLEEYLKGECKMGEDIYKTVHSYIENKLKGYSTAKEANSSNSALRRTGSGNNAAHLYAVAEGHDRGI